MKYIFFDGDNVGNTIEKFLIENKVNNAQILSENITKSLKSIKEKLSPSAKMILLGGDDILISVKDDSEIDDLVEIIRKVFQAKTGLTLSCGIGNSIQSAIYQLSLAKLYGKDQVKKEQTK